MRKNNGFTLIELQMSSLMLVVILVTTGVIFYFALATIRYMHEAFDVYANSVTAMKVITQEVMVSNCFGPIRGSAPAVASAAPESFWGVNGYVHVGGGGQVARNASVDFPNWNGSSAEFVTDGSMGTGLYLRQAVGGARAGDFPEHEIVYIYRDWNADPLRPFFQLWIDRGAGGFLVADYVSEFAFSPMAYNAIAVRITCEGLLTDPLGGGIRHSITLTKMIALRCAPLNSPVSSGNSW
jgi:hypothetical protein